MDRLLRTSPLLTVYPPARRLLSRRLCPARRSFSIGGDDFNAKEFVIIHYVWDLEMQDRKDPGSFYK